jgi:hypothetical protein
VLFALGLPAFPTDAKRLSKRSQRLRCRFEHTAARTLSGRLRADMAPA